MRGTHAHCSWVLIVSPTIFYCRHVPATSGKHGDEAAYETLQRERRRWLPRGSSWHPDTQTLRDVHVELPGLDDWLVHVDVVTGGGLARLDISRKKGAAGLITKRMLKQLPIREIEERARAAARELWGFWDDDDVPRELQTRAKQLVKEFDQSPRPGPTGRGDEFYAHVAATYVAHLDSHRPIEQTADKLSLSTARIRNLVYEARRRGLLTKVTRGRAGGELTDKAKELLGAAQTPLKKGTRGHGTR